VNISLSATKHAHNNDRYAGVVLPPCVW